MSVVPVGALKRKRGAGAAVLDAAQRGENRMVGGIRTNAPNVRILANNQLHIPSGRSGARHLAKVNPTLHERKSANVHVHDLFRKYTRKTMRNGIEAHMQTYMP